MSMRVKSRFGEPAIPNPRSIPWGDRTMVRSATMAVLAMAIASHARGGDWPSWRGPTGMGVADTKNLPLNWSGKDGQNVIWKKPLPGTDGKAKLDHNQSSPIVCRDRVFLIMVYWPQ